MERLGGKDIQDRSEQYGLRVIRLFRYLKRQKLEEGWVIGRQLLRSATSVGASLSEADAAETRKDFIHKCRIALKEARESRFWLRLLLLAEIVPASRLEEIMDETEQLIAILVAIVKNASNPKAAR